MRAILIQGIRYSPMLSPVRPSYLGYDSSSHTQARLHPWRSPKKRLRPKTPTPPASPKLYTAPIDLQTSSIIATGLSANTHLQDPLTSLQPALAKMHLPAWIRDIGPKKLAELQVDHEGDLQLGSITSSELQNWTCQNPEVADSDNIRYEYNYLTERFIVKCMPTPTHDSLQLYFTDQVLGSLNERFGRTQTRKMVRVGSGTSMSQMKSLIDIYLTNLFLAFKEFTGDWAGSSQKLPDAYVKPLNKKFPTIVCEAGFAESLEDLKADAKLWLLHTGGQTRIVFVLCVIETKPKTRKPALDLNQGTEDNDDQTDDTADAAETTLTTQESADDEQILLNSIDESTEVNDLTEQLFFLNQQGKLTQPLLGSLEATFYVYRAVKGGQDIEASFVATMLPPPPTAHKDKSNPTEFKITMQDILDNSLPRDTKPTEEIAFSLAVLQEYIETSIPATERLRATTRAENLLEALRGSNDEPTFSKRKRQRLGPIGIWE